MNNQMIIGRYVTIEIERLYPKAEELGTLAGRIFSGQRDERSRSQLTNLLNVSHRARSPVEVMSHIKKQAAKHNEWRQDDFAQKLLNVLDDDLRKAARNIAGKLTPPAGEEEQAFFEIHLRLIRNFIAHMNAQFEYSRALAASARSGRDAKAVDRQGGNRR